MMTRVGSNIALEVCVDSLASAEAASAHAAHRIELNAALELGGLTPSIGLVERVVASLAPTRCKMIAMVRPRPGGFCYDPDARAVMRSDIDRLLAAGVDGVALGVLAPSGAIDEAATLELIRPVLQAGKQAVFHRAFDLTPDPLRALDCLVSLGFHRVLTSGQAPTAHRGAALIRELIRHADGRIQVLPGSGINPQNVAQLIRDTGCDQVHTSLRRVIADPSGSANPTIRFDSPPPRDGGYHQADRAAVAAMIRALDETA